MYYSKEEMKAETNFHTKVTPKLRFCTEEEFDNFIKNYPNKLYVDFFMDAYSWNDFTLADKWPDTMVAMRFLAWYPNEEDEFKIAENMDEVFTSMDKGE